MPGEKYRAPALGPRRARRLTQERPACALGPGPESLGSLRPCPRPWASRRRGPRPPLVVGVRGLGEPRGRAQGLGSRRRRRRRCRGSLAVRDARAEVGARRAGKRRGGEAARGRAGGAAGSALAGPVGEASVRGLGRGWVGGPRRCGWWA